jgi:hypothetical protein
MTFPIGGSPRIDPSTSGTTIRKHGPAPFTKPIEKGDPMKQLLLLALTIVACTNESDTIRTLQSAGYSEITTTGYSAWACGDDDTFSTGFRAKNPVGTFVEGTVCCGGWTKGCTIRF